MALVKLSQIKGGTELQQDVENLKKSGGAKNIVFVASVIKRGESTAEIFFPYAGKCTEINAAIGTFNSYDDEENGVGEVKLELQSYIDEVWETLVPLTINPETSTASRKNLEVLINNVPLRIRLTKANNKVVDLSVIATIQIDSSKS
jgi:hypothetical protein